MTSTVSLELEIIELKKQLEHERSERESAQRTIARLGGGIAQMPSAWPVCRCPARINATAQAAASLLQVFAATAQSWAGVHHEYPWMRERARR